MLLFVSSALAGFAQPQVYLDSLGSPQQATLRGVVDGAAKLELERAGLKALVVGGAADLSDAAVVRAARRSGSPFLLLVRYRTESDTVALAASFIDAGSGRSLQERKESLAVDLNLDAHVAAAVRSLLEDRAVQEAIEAARRAEARERSARSPVRAAVLQAGGRPSGASWGLAAGVQVAPLFLIGGGSNYFRYGADLSLFGGVQLTVRTLSLQTGLHVGATQLFPVAGLLPGSAYLFLGGPEVRLGTASGAVRVAARASGGAAVIMVRMDGQAAQATTVPYAEGGLDASVEVMGGLALGMELDFLTAFESEYPIMGFAPSLTVGTRW